MPATIEGRSTTDVLLEAILNEIKSFVQRYDLTFKV